MFMSYDFAAFCESEFLKRGDYNIASGDRFTMPLAESVKLLARDDDAVLNGRARKDVSEDRTQSGSVDDVPAPAGGNIFIEKIFAVSGSDGKEYRLAEIQIEGVDAPGKGEDFFAFVGDVPAAGVVLTVGAADYTAQADYADLNPGVDIVAKPGGTPTPPPPKPDPDPDPTPDPDPDPDPNPDPTPEDRTASVSGRYFCDENGNGLEDPGEAGVVGVRIGLKNFTTGEIQRVFTDANGAYSFEGLAPGEYHVRFPKDLTGKTFVTADVGSDDSIDSDAATVWKNGEAATDKFILGAGETVTDVDGGIEAASFADAVIEGRLFADTNGNGIDENARGVAGVKVDLLDGSGGLLASTTSAENGSYIFDGLLAGDYVVRFPTEADGKTLTSQNAGSDDTLDSDADVTTGLTDPIDLGEGARVSDVDAGLVATLDPKPDPDPDPDPTPENTGPVAVNDEGAVCATEAVEIDVLDNDSDADGDGLLVAEVNGVTLEIGESTELASGAVVTLNSDGKLSYDSAGAVIDGVAAGEILIGTEASDSFEYTVVDGQGGSASGTVAVTLKGGLNTVETILADLPATATTALGGFRVGQGYDATLDETGDARLDGLKIEAGYCVERTEDFVAGTDIEMAILGGTAEALDGSLFSNDLVENIDKINWLLNQDFGAQDNGDGTGRTYTDAEIQHVIWGLTDGNSTMKATGVINGKFNGTQANIEEMLALANANGDGYETGPGGVLTLVLDPASRQAGVSEADDHDQAFIVSVAYDDFLRDCIC